MQAHKIYSWNYQQNKNRDSFFARLFYQLKVSKEKENNCETYRKRGSKLKPKYRTQWQWSGLIRIFIVTYNKNQCA